MKLTEQHTAFLSPVSLEVEKAFLSYRLGMRVTEVRGSIPLCTEKQDTTSVLDAKPLWNGNSYPLRQMHDFIYIPVRESMFSRKLWLTVLLQKWRLSTEFCA